MMPYTSIAVRSFLRARFRIKRQGALSACLALRGFFRRVALSPEPEGPRADSWLRETERCTAVTERRRPRRGWRGRASRSERRQCAAAERSRRRGMRAGRARAAQLAEPERAAHSAAGALPCIILGRISEIRLYVYVIIRYTIIGWRAWR